MCPCGNQIEYSRCCELFHKHQLPITDALTLMKSRYSAYVYANADYILNTTHPNKVHLHHKKDMLNWAKANKWLKLEIISHNINTVEFKAYYFNNKMQLEVHHERSRFEQLNNKWYYLDAIYF